MYKEGAPIILGEKIITMSFETIDLLFHTVFRSLLKTTFDYEELLYNVMFTNLTLKYRIGRRGQSQERTRIAQFFVKQIRIIFSQISRNGKFYSICSNFLVVNP